MQKPVTPYSAKAFGEHMLHQQLEEIFSCNGSVPIFSGLGMDISESDHFIFTFQDILLLNNALLPTFLQSTTHFSGQFFGARRL
jgi:hypothetical protein